MDIILKNIKLVGNDTIVSRLPTKEEEPLICKQIGKLFMNILDALGNENEEAIMDMEEFIKITDPLFFYENEEVFWTIIFDSIGIG